MKAKRHFLKFNLLSDCRYLNQELSEESTLKHGGGGAGKTTTHPWAIEGEIKQRSSSSKVFPSLKKSVSKLARKIYGVRYKLWQQKRRKTLQCIKKLSSVLSGLITNTKWACGKGQEFQASFPRMPLKTQGPLVNGKQTASSAKSISGCSEKKQIISVLILILKSKTSVTPTLKKLHLEVVEVAIL